MTDVELVNMPVPRPLIPAVTALVNDYYNPGPAPQPASEASVEPRRVDPSEAVEVPQNGLWDRARVESLLDGWHNGAGLALVEAVARRTLAGHDATTWGELRDATGQEYGQARSNLGALSKHAIKTVGEKVWPMHCTDLGNAVPSEDRYVYRMPAEVAQWVLEVTA